MSDYEIYANEIIASVNEVEGKKRRSIGESDTLAILQSEFDNYGVEYSQIHCTHCA